jgi:hypothetical protein
MGGGSSPGGVEGSSVGGSSLGGVEGSSMGGDSSAGAVEGSSAAGSGVSVVGGGGDDGGSLEVGGGSSAAAGGAASPVLLLGELLVLLGGLGSDVSREGSRVACGADDSFMGAADRGAHGAAVVGVWRAAETGTGPALADRLVAISRSLSPAHGIFEPAAVTPSRALLGTVSSSAPISATTCLTTTSRGWLMGLSELGASQERSETTNTAAATTPAPASAYQRPMLPRRPSRPIRAAMRAGVFTPRPSSSSLRTSRFSIGLSMRSAPLPLTAVVRASGLVDLLVARR